MEEQEALRAFAALSQQARLRVYRVLVVAGPLGLTPGALASELGAPASTLSFHLKELTQSGLVTQQRDGRHLIYRAAFDRMDALIGYLTAHCCQGTDCLSTPRMACAAT